MADLSYHTPNPSSPGTEPVSPAYGADSYAPDPDGRLPETDRYDPDTDRYGPETGGYTPETDEYTPEGNRAYDPDGDNATDPPSRRGIGPLGAVRDRFRRGGKTKGGKRNSGRSSGGGSGGPSGKPSGGKKKLSAAERKKRRAILRMIIIGGILIGGFFFWKRLHNSGQSDGGEPLTDFVQYGSITSTVEGSGLTRAKDSETIVIGYNGVVQEVLVEEGDLVEEGQPLFRVDSEDARKAVEDAEKGVTRAREAVTKAQEAVQSALDNVTDAEQGVVDARKAVSDREKDVENRRKDAADARKRVTEARDKVTEAQDKVTDAKKDLDETLAKQADLEVGCDFDGKLTAVRTLTAGDKIGKEETIATLVDDTRFRLTQFYSYAYLGQIREGQMAEVSIASRMDSVPGTVETVHTDVSHISEGSQFFSAVIVLENPGGLTPETEASAVIPADGERIYSDGAAKLEYYRTTAVKPKVGGGVLEAALWEDRKVSAGQVILRLDDSELKDEIKAAEKAVEDAEKAVEAAEDGVKSAQEAVESADKAIEAAQEAVENARKGVETALKAVEDRKKAVTDAQENVTENQKAVVEALQKVDEAQEKLEKLDAAAPIAGKVIGLDIMSGDEVTSGKAAVTISNTTSLIVNAMVDERNMGYIKKGMTVELDQWGTSAEGVVESISLSSTVNNGVATYPMVISVDNEGEALQVNSNIQYKLIASESDNCLVVPVQAVRSVSNEDGDSLTVVYVRGDVEEYAEGVIAGEEIPEDFHPLEVEIGIQDSFHVEIKSGLTEGMEVFLQMASQSMW